MGRQYPAALGIRDYKKLMEQSGETLSCPWDRPWGSASASTPWHVYQVGCYGGEKPHRIWSMKTRQSAYNQAKDVIITWRKSGGYAMVFNYLTNETFTVK